VAKRGDALELAVLGLLRESPMHGYELRKRVTSLLGWGRVLSYGSLYPCLKQMLRDGLIAEDTTHLDGPTAASARAGRRGKIVYKLTADGKDRFEALVSATGPSAWEDDNFGVHFAFFGSATAETRIRILEGRRSRLEERLEGVRTSLARSRERVNAYTLELQRHGLESVEREVRWLTELIDSERVSKAPGATTTTTTGPVDPQHPAASDDEAGTVGEQARTTSTGGTPSGAHNRE
jgi:DNA-binding PadR family transcriptional regulator